MDASPTIALEFRPSGKRDLTKLPGTLDKIFCADDEMSYALVPSHGPLVGGLSSKSVQNCRLSAGQKPQIRSTGSTGITGGFVEGAQGERTITPGAQAATCKDRRRNRRNRNARTTATRTIDRAAILAALRERGYAV